MKFEPKLPKRANSCTVGCLKIGDCFLCNGRLHLLTKKDPEAVELSTGIIWDIDCDEQIIVVDCTIHWTEKPKKKKKKK